MYCPNCGTKTSVDQNFCRACGLGLEKIAVSLLEQQPARADQSLAARKERLEKLGVAMLSVFGAGVLIFLLYSIGQKFISRGDLFGLLVMLGPRHDGLWYRVSGAVRQSKGSRCRGYEASAPRSRSRNYERVD